MLIFSVGIIFLTSLTASFENHMLFEVSWRVLCLFSECLLFWNLRFPKCVKSHFPQCEFFCTISTSQIDHSQFCVKRSHFHLCQSLVLFVSVSIARGARKGRKRRTSMCGPNWTTGLSCHKHIHISGIDNLRFSGRCKTKKRWEKESGRRWKTTTSRRFKWLILVLFRWITSHLVLLCDSGLDKNIFWLNLRKSR